MRTWILCEDCHRVLWAEHGPVCPECKQKRKEAERRKPKPPPEPEEWRIE